MRSDKLKKRTDFRDEVVAISRAIAVAQTQPTPMDSGAAGKGKSGKVGKGAKGAGKRNNQTQEACSRCGNTDHTSANCPHSDKTCRKCGKVGHLASVCRSSGAPHPKAKGGQKGKGGGKGANAVKTCWNCGESGHMSSQCPKKKAHAVEESTTASQVGSQDTIMVGSVESYFDVGSVSEVTLEPRGAGDKICSMDAPNVREGESVDIEIGSDAKVSCLLVNIGADAYPLHETRLSMCGGHHVAAGGGKLQQLGARILGLEAANVQGDVVNLLVRFRAMNIGKALLSTQDLSRCGWETVFQAGCGDAYLVRKTSDTRITLVKKRCAWYLRVKLKPHSELPYIEGEEFL